MVNTLGPREDPSSYYIANWPLWVSRRSDVAKVTVEDVRQGNDDALASRSG